MTYRTRYLKDENGANFPGDLWIEIIGSGTCIDDAVTRFANSGLAALPVIAVACNTAIRVPEFELAFESTKGLTSRPFVQAFIQKEQKRLIPLRFVGVDCVGALGKAIMASPRHERIMRACSQYLLALNEWKAGLATMAVGHLWMGVEAITKVMLENALASEGVASNQELATKWALNDIKDLDGAVRRRLIFHGDDAAYTETRALSDGLEHGFMEFGVLRTRAEAVRRTAAGHLRRAILESLGGLLANEDLGRLNASPYDTPLGYSSVQALIKGSLLGAGEELAREGEQYPLAHWSPSYAYQVDEDRQAIDVKIHDHFEMRLGPGIAFAPDEVTAWSYST